MVAPNSTYSLAYNGTDEGLATWAFPDGFNSFGPVTSGTFQIAVGYSLYDDDGYNMATLDGGNPITGTLTADTQLQYAPEQSTWMLVAGGLGWVARRARRQY